jgi:hypothetical protein
MRRAAFAFWAAAFACATCPRGATAAPFAPTLAADAQVRTLAGNGIAGNLDGPRAQAEFVFPTAVAVDKRSGAIFVADPGGQRIRKIAPDGTVTTVAGGGAMLPSGLEVAGGYVDGPAAAARFNRPSGVAVGPDGALYVADSFNHCIRKIAGGFVTTFAGNPKNPGGSDGALADATFLEPRSIAAASDGTLYVADFTVGVRVIAPSGLVSSLGFTGSDLYGISLWEGPDFSVIYAATKFTVASYNIRSNGGGGMFSTPQRASGTAPTGVVGLGPDSAAVASATWQGIFFEKFSGGWSPYNGFSRLMLGPDEKDWQQKGGFSDGAVAGAEVYDPLGMALDAHGDIVLADAGNRRIRLLPAPDVRWALSGDDRLPPKPAGVYRIAVFGDAANFSNAMADDSIAADLERRLAADSAKIGLAGRKVEVETISLAAADLSTQSQYLATRVPAGSLDTVIWSLGSNAFDQFPRGGTLFEDQPFVEGVIKHTAARLQAKGISLVLAMHPIASEMTAGEATYTMLLGPGGAIDPGLRNFMTTEGFTGSLGLPEIPVAQRFVDVERGPHVPLFGTDDGHLTPAGNALYAQILGDGLSALHPWGAPGAAPAAH